MIQINGELKEGYEEKTLAGMIEQEGFDRTRIATEINGTIVSKQNYDETILHDGDIVEVVNFVGGGSL